MVDDILGRKLWDAGTIKARLAAGESMNYTHVLKVAAGGTASPLHSLISLRVVSSQPSHLEQPM